MDKTKSDEIVETKLYGGEVLLQFHPRSHRYKISDRGSKPAYYPSVTTVLNVLNKPALVEWGVRVACDYVELGLRDLMQGESFSAESVLSLVSDARQAHNRVKQEAAGIGTDAHDWLAQYWRAKMDLAPPPPALEEGPVKNCTTAALDWIGKHEVIPIRIEQAQYSRKYQITGTADFIGWVDGVMSVIDYKSTKAIWPEIALQMAPYASTYTEEFDVPIVNRWALRMDKFSGQFEDRKFAGNTFDEDMDTFLAAFKLYDRLKFLRRKPKVDWIGELVS